MSNRKKITSKRAASAAGRVLVSKRSSRDAKIAAGSALAQRPSKGKVRVKKQRP